MTINQKQFESLWGKIEPHPILKTRYYIPLDNGYIAELDIYHDFLEGLVTVEVEFESISEAGNFTPPNWFAVDITYNDDFKNSSLSKNHSLPKI